MLIVNVDLEGVSQDEMKEPEKIETLPKEKQISDDNDDDDDFPDEQEIFKAKRLINLNGPVKRSFSSLFIEIIVRYFLVTDGLSSTFSRSNTFVSTCNC